MIYLTLNKAIFNNYRNVFELDGSHYDYDEMILYFKQLSNEGFTELTIKPKSNDISLMKNISTLISELIKRNPNLKIHMEN